jgi:hypothetical protein
MRTRFVAQKAKRSLKSRSRRPWSNDSLQAKGAARVMLGETAPFSPIQQSAKTGGGRFGENFSLRAVVGLDPKRYR